MDVPAPLGLAIIGAGLFVVWLFYRGKIRRINAMPPIPSKIDPQGFEVPILAAFGGMKRFPGMMSFSHNNVNPLLTLFEDRIECRVLRDRSIPLSEIESVDIRDTFATRNLNVYVRGREDVFTANLLSRRNLAVVLEFLARRGVLLSQRAEDFVRANEVQQP